MIKLTNSNGVSVFLATAAIAQITEAGVSSQWHGIKSFVKTFDGSTIEVQESTSEIMKAMNNV